MHRVRCRVRYFLLPVPLRPRSSTRLETRPSSSHTGGVEVAQHCHCVPQRALVVVSERPRQKPRPEVLQNPPRLAHLRQEPQPNVQRARRGTGRAMPRRHDAHLVPGQNRLGQGDPAVVADVSTAQRGGVYVQTEDDAPVFDLGDDQRCLAQGTL